MNRNVLSIMLALAIAAIGLASLSCSSNGDTNRDASLTTNRNTRAEPVDTASIEAALKKAEADWANAYKTKDAATIRRILADDIVLTYPDGTTGTKADEIQMTETGAFSADSWEVVDSKVSVIDADAAFMTGRTVIKNGKLKDPKSGHTIDISGEYRFLDVYAKRNGNWQTIASQVTKIAEPAAAPAASPAAKASPTAKASPAAKASATPAKPAP
ncbi:MAG TPA: nuclear transport factor 2 family protein [Pyrinomonadaceae bacterium]|jgi:ketosteroid isomerase-like protein|nr:nuclear transport factor 2 family protein [Pyrinomonadaceae bacterium]